MPTQCTSADLTLEGLGRREVVGKFDGGRMSSDGGSLLLRASNRVLDLTARLARCFTDYRDERRTEHSVEALVGQRVYGLALGYEDLNDHDRLRDDSVLALALEREDVRGESRVRERDRGHALAGSSTLNRLELGEPESGAEHRYKKLVAHHEALDALLVDLFVRAHQEAPEEIVLDLDATDDPLHGHQEGRFFHRYYRCYCKEPSHEFPAHTDRCDQPQARRHSGCGRRDHCSRIRRHRALDRLHVPRRTGHAHRRRREPPGGRDGRRYLFQGAGRADAFTAERSRPASITHECSQAQDAEGLPLHSSS